MSLPPAGDSVHNGAVEDVETTGRFAPRLVPAGDRVTAPAVPFVALAREHAALQDELLAAVSAVIAGGQFILGAEVERFEERFARLSGTRFAIGMDNGTSALIQALR